ncbi:MAG: hypothetical protein IVW52_18190 [Acidimicrobiales bacterium]|nr:hypothetical protein [Acidimicrobiales bacterium]
MEERSHGVGFGSCKMGTSAVLGVVDQLGVSTEQFVEQLAAFVRSEALQRGGGRLPASAHVEGQVQ